MKFYKLGNGRAKLVGMGFTFEGELAQVTELLQERGMDWETVGFMLAEMHRKGHDAAELGDLAGDFEYSYSSGEMKGVLLELEAIRSLREEFANLHRQDPTARETRDAWDRLMNLYFSLNVDEALDLLKPEERAAA